MLGNLLRAEFSRLLYRRRATYSLVLAGVLEAAVWRQALEAAGLARLGGEGREREVIRLLDSACKRAEARDLSTVGVRP